MEKPNVINFDTLNQVWSISVMRKLDHNDIGQYCIIEIEIPEKQFKAYYEQLVNDKYHKILKGLTTKRFFRRPKYSETDAIVIAKKQAIEYVAQNYVFLRNIKLFLL